MGQRTLLPDTAEFVLDQLQVQGREQIVMILRPALEESRCPAWRRRSDRIHRWYRRQLCDLERGRVFDLRAGRSAKSTEHELRTHPGSAAKCLPMALFPPQQKRAFGTVDTPSTAFRLR